MNCRPCGAGPVKSLLRADWSSGESAKMQGAEVGFWRGRCGQSRVKDRGGSLVLWERRFCLAREALFL